MKSYLSLIPISERKHKKQSRMTRICIVLAVFLVTAIFSMAETEMRNQLRQTIREDGYWHMNISHISEEDADSIREMSGVKLVSAYGAANYHLDKGYLVNGTNAIICGFEENFKKIYEDISVEGNMPLQENEALISRNMATEMNKVIGDSFTITLPDGSEKELLVSGIVEDTSMLSKEDCYGIDLNVEGFCKLTNSDKSQITYFVQVKDNTNVRQVINEISKKYEGSEAKVGENIKLLGITGLSTDSYMMQLYMTAGVLALLVIFAGVLMITSSINSNMAKRTEFFGMLRCLGASKKQIKRFVTLEALSWCKLAIPIGVILGSLVSCILCAGLRAMSPAYFADMPIFAVSKIGVIMGCVIGVVTVLAAAVSPANKAAKVSPLTAVSGNAYCGYQKSSKMHLWILPIEVKLGMHHSYQSKKNFMLMVSSFALSIILFLSFSMGIDFLHHALRPLQVYTPDISIYSGDNICEIDKAIVSEINQIPEVKNVYGRSFSYNLPTQDNEVALNINLLSYEQKQFEWSEDKILEGSLENVINGNEVMTVYYSENPLHVGDKITIETETGKKEVTVGAILSDSPFSRDENCETVICSESTFEQLTGQGNYTIIDIQLASVSFFSNVTSKEIDDAVQQIKELFPETYVFSDQRENNESIRGAYLSMSLFIYGFIVIIALISMFQIINSVAMSVNARFHQYGAMRAIGASNSQIIRMIISESITYGISGTVLGIALGIPLHRLLFRSLITFKWGDVWKMPGGLLLLIVTVIMVSCLIAVLRPTKEIKDMSVVDTLTTI